MSTSGSAGEDRRERRRTIFVHIGTHKTGSTSIQHFLTHHADELAREGISFPAAGRFLFGHHHVAWELGHDPRLQGHTGHVQRLLEELRDGSPDVAIVSSEDFEYLARYPVSLGGFVSGLRAIAWEPVFVVFFRERWSYLESLAAALANHGVTHSQAWYREQVDRNDAVLVKDDWWFDFDRQRFVSTWSEITAAPIIALEYDSGPGGAGVLPAFLRAVGASDGLIEASRAWPRLNARAGTERDGRPH